MKPPVLTGLFIHYLLVGPVLNGGAIGPSAKGAL